MYNISICDDDQLFSESLANKISSFFESVGTSVQIHIFNNGAQQLSCSNHLDLCFIDIFMPEMSGDELASHIRENFNTDQCTIIFVSSIHDAVYHTLQYSPFRFIRKEFLNEELPEALSAFCQSRQKSTVSASISLDENGAHINVPVSSIYLIETSGHYLNVFCQHHTYHIRGKLTEYEQKLNQNYFCKVNQGCLINLANIAFFNANYITLKNGTEVRLTRTCKDTFRCSYLKWERNCFHVLTI